MSYTVSATSGRRLPVVLLASLLATLSCLLLTLPATATAEEENALPKLWKTCTGGGGAAGECLLPRGIGADPVTGHLYVADANNKRIVEFTAWGEFVKAWGWGVDDGSPELQTCTAASGCQAGVQGSGVGQFTSPQAVAVDSEGNVYVTDLVVKARVQKFDSEGNFLLMFGGGVNQGPIHPGDICTAQHIAEGDACGAGASGTGNGQLSASLGIAIGSADQIYVGDKNRIQVFNTQGEYQSQLPLPGAEEVVRALAVDPPSGDLYFAPDFPENASDKEMFSVSKLDSESGEVLATLGLDRPTALAVDPDGNLFVFDGPLSSNDPSHPSHPGRILEFDPAGKQIARFGDEIIGAGQATEFSRVWGMAAGSACFSKGAGLYVSNSVNVESFFQPLVRAFGIPDRTDVCTPPSVAPDVTAEYAISVGSNETSVGAQINPHFWPDTTYHVEYGTAECLEDGWEAPCVKDQPSGPGAQLGGGVSTLPLPTAAIFLTGLEPATTYRYRFVAQSGGGGPTLGKGRQFHTPQLPAASNTNCPNQAFRGGPSATLPDCRAYELVSPLDKAGGDVTAPLNLSVYEARMDQAAVDGDSLAYSSYRPFAGALGAPFVSQYIARRDSQLGWQTEAISPPQEGPTFINPLNQVDNAYRAFSPDLETGWVRTATEPVLGLGGRAGHANLYRRDNAGNVYESCTTTQPMQTEVNNRYPTLQAVSADHQLAIFRNENRLTEDAADEYNDPDKTLPRYQLYACAFGEGGPAQVRLVSVLPNGSASKLTNTTGGPANGQNQIDEGRGATLEHALSTDGSRVFWTANDSSEAPGPGTLYVRLNPTQPESAHLLGVAGGKGDLIGPVSATGNGINGAKTITEVKVKFGAFAVGQELSGTGIAAGTVITAVEAGKLKVDKSLKANLSGTEFFGVASEVVSNVTVETGAFAAGQEISGPGIPGDTTIASVEEVSAGVFKLTLSAKATQSGNGVGLSATSECTEAAKACTLEIESGDARFWNAAEDGSVAIFGHDKSPSGEDLSEYEVDSGETHPIAGKVQGVLGASADASRVYFLSGEEIGGEGISGEKNLYLYEANGGGGGSYAFIGTLSQEQNPNFLGHLMPGHNMPLYRASRVSPDGTVVAFLAHGPELAEEVADYDNTDQATGLPAAEVYRFEIGEGLACVSCNPTGARPMGRDIARGSQASIAAAKLPPWLNSLYAPRALSEDGARVFFESYEPLVSSDTNGKADVYQWEAQGSGSCEEGVSTYVEASGGCLDLISTGKSPDDSQFVDASPDGRDVFIRTAESLVGWDPGQTDIFDARIEGGLPAPPSQPAACEGEACQGTPTPPDDPTPSSSTFEGAGNVQAETARGRKPCAKGKVRRKGRCVAKKHKKRAHHRRANRNGRAGR